MTGPFTPVGWLLLLGVLALVVGMAWLGWRARWKVGLLLTLPFMVLLIWSELKFAGPMFENPYGLVLAMIVLGPIVIGWTAFLLFRAGSKLRRHHH